MFKPWTHPLARLLSCLLATPLVLILLLHPGLFVHADGRYAHGALMGVMLGLSGAIVHGVGFDPVSRPWRWVFHPWLAWPLLSWGYVLLWRAQGLSA
ncbi:cyd operon YbgE family protein [Atopomonas sediminilitoris]|uniref:cyd operon YbgE family protein n=1 Tax=Atopomonas sediminilitoris TaxID=2919919 RepID=UPI001F4D9761|nr:cyd operon YbgE family protein [Atopomonas sediminilitoris]MCJ8169494.1 cyd operon YbgE family protein [Atopomonas sediminilitoris]